MCRFLDGHYRNLTAALVGFPVVVVSVRAGTTVFAAESMGVPYSSLPTIRLLNGQGTGGRSSVQLDPADLPASAAALETAWRRATTAGVGAPGRAP